MVITSRPTPAAARIWFVELAIALAFATIAAAVIEPNLFAGSAELPSFSPASGSGPLVPPVVEASVSPPPAPSGHQYDVVIAGGRVMDPESGFDRAANVGIDEGRIATITDAPLKGRKVIEAQGKVVAPGFIDIESYDPNPYGIWYKIADGVTTNLGMHGTNGNAEEWYSRWQATGVPTHFGGAFDGNWARQLPDGLALGVGDEATPAQIDLLATMAEEALQDGYIGVEFSPEYAPGITYEEMRAVAEVAALYNVPVFIHGRYSDDVEPGTNFDTIDEVVQLGRDTGAAVHLLHINSTGGTFTMPASLEMLEQARDEGVEITTDTYPYDFWATYLESERFAPGWQERFHIDYGDLVVPGEGGEPLTETTFELYRNDSTPTLTAAYAIPEEDVRTALRSPFVMVGSDAILEEGDNNHPRAAGTFARVLGKYVREDQVISLMDALSKMTIQPAELLEQQAPALRKKGRLQIGADADIVVFDPTTVRDRATVNDPSRYSEGIEWVLVMGEIVKDPEGLHKSTLPGQPIMSDFANLETE